MREDHIASAIAFLRESQVASAALAKKVDFLESKGLTNEEINEALKRVHEDSQGASTSTTTAGPTSPTAFPSEYIPPRPNYMLQTPPPVPRRDWKDYFVMATVSVGLAYGIYECTRRYVLPMIMPPTPAALEADKEALEAEFERTEQLVKQLQEDTAAIMKQEKLRTVEFNRVMNQAREVIESIKDQSEERKQESKLALTNVESLRDLLPRALKQHSEVQANAITELQTELKSLKQLLFRRQAGVTPQVPPASSVPSSLPGFPRKPKAKPEEPPKDETSEKQEQNQEPLVESAKEPPADAQPEAKEEIKDFVPDPQAGIPAWQRAAANST